MNLSEERKKLFEDWSAAGISELTTPYELIGKIGALMAKVYSNDG
jgi:hypothetical protein